MAGRLSAIETVTPELIATAELVVDYAELLKPFRYLFVAAARWHR